MNSLALDEYLKELSLYLKDSITFVDETYINMMNRIQDFTQTTVIDLKNLNLELEPYKMILKRNHIQMVKGLFFITQFTKEILSQIKNAIKKYQISNILILSSFPNEFYRGEITFDMVKKELGSFYSSIKKNSL